jgi:preprotein translocase subunit SecF
MIQLFKNVNIDWLANRRIFITISILLMLAGLASAVYRHAFHPNGTEAFNLGVDFKGGTVITARFPKQRPSDESIRATIQRAGINDAVIQPITDKPNQVLIKVPRQGSPSGADMEDQAQVDAGRTKIKQALDTFGAEGDAYEIIGTDAVGAVAGVQLRNQAIAVTLLAMVGILGYIAFRFEWTYGAAAVIAVFHDVLVTLGFFSIFQWEIDLTVIAALLTLVGFSVNDTIVTFDRIRENLRLHRRESLYKITNDSINQTLSRTIITSGLVLLSVIAMVTFGGAVLRGFSLALLIGIIFGTYSSIAIASPIMVWWQQRLEARSRSSSSSGGVGAPPTKTTGGAAAARARTSRSANKSDAKTLAAPHGATRAIKN